MSIKINKVALPGISGNKWDICQYNEINYLPEVNSTPAYPGMICPSGGDFYLSGYFGENTNTLAWTRLDLNVGEAGKIANMQTVYNRSTTAQTNLSFVNNSNFAECDDVWLPLGKRNSYAVNVSGTTNELTVIWTLIKCLALIPNHNGYATTAGTFAKLRTRAFTYVDNGTLSAMPIPYLQVNGLSLNNPVCKKITYGKELCATADTYNEEYLDLHFEVSFGYLILRCYRNGQRIRLGFEVSPCTDESLDGYDMFGLNSPSLGAIENDLVNYAYYTSHPNKAIHRFLRKDMYLHMNYNHTKASIPRQFWWCHPLLFQDTYGTGYQVASCKRFLRLDLFDEVLNTVTMGVRNSDGYYTMAPVFDEIVRISPNKDTALVEYVIDEDGSIDDEQWAPHNILTSPITFPSELLYKYRVGTASSTTTTTTTSSTAAPTMPLVNYHITVLNHYGDQLSSDEQSMCSATIYDAYGKEMQKVYCEESSSLHFYQIGGSTRIPSYIIVTYRDMSKTISNLDTTASSEYTVDFSEDIESVRRTYNLVPHVMYRGQEVRTYQIGQYADYNFDEVNWENRFTTDGMSVYLYNDANKIPGVDPFTVYEKHPNKVFIIPYGVSGMAESYGPIWIPETAGDIHHFEIELAEEQSFAPDLP